MRYWIKRSDCKSGTLVDGLRQLWAIHRICPALRDAACRPPFEGSIVIHVLIVFIGLIGELGQIGLILYTVPPLFGVQTSAWRVGIRMPHRKVLPAPKHTMGLRPFGVDISTTAAEEVMIPPSLKARDFGIGHIGRHCWGTGTTVHWQSTGYFHFGTTGMVELAFSA
jgi:hypothetical protein